MYRNLDQSVLYQMFLRTMTPEGTFKGAERMLPNLASLGFDIVYLCPIAQADPDEDQTRWSSRQHKAKTFNPKNPYRISDYFAIDTDYGTLDDCISFVNKAHELGMRVMVDLVYYHCGPKAVFIKEHPEFLKYDKDGKVIDGEWHFPQLNFNCEGLREYLYSNMLWYIRDLDFDGFRCDVATGIPLDFWREGVRRCREIKPDLIMLSEGENASFLLDNVFDLNYEFSFGHKLLDSLKSGDVTELRARWEATEAKNPRTGAVVRFFDQHDFANESYDIRYETLVGGAAVEAALTFAGLCDGVPFIYNGYEACDRARHSIFSDRNHGRHCIDWSGALTDAGRKRSALLRRLADLRHDNPALGASAATKWLDCDKRVAVIERTAGDQRVIVAVNFSAEPVSAVIECSGEPMRELLSRGTSRRKGDSLLLELDPRGFVVIEMR